MRRSPGISALVSCQNEEATVGPCIGSFVEFADEVIVVDNGSTDQTKSICREMARQYPKKVKFFDAPHLKDLYENRQYALERSKHQWIVRADADYVCYTSGPYDCRHLREHILGKHRPWVPVIYHLIQPNVHLDYWHTADPEAMAEDAGKAGGCGGRKDMPVVAEPMARIYRHVPGFRFARLGRFEGARLGRLAGHLVQNIHWPTPIWMHCNIKSDENLLFRSERTNWREQGDFERYPTLDTFLRESIQREYGTDCLAEAARVYVEKNVLPFLKPYDEQAIYPYPDLVREAMRLNPVYRIGRNAQGNLHRQRVEAPAAWDLKQSA